MHPSPRTSDSRHRHPVLGAPPCISIQPVKEVVELHPTELPPLPVAPGHVSCASSPRAVPPPHPTPPPSTLSARMASTRCRRMRNLSARAEMVHLRGAGGKWVGGQGPGGVRRQPLARVRVPAVLSLHAAANRHTCTRCFPAPTAGASRKARVHMCCKCKCSSDQGTSTRVRLGDAAEPWAPSPCPWLQPDSARTAWGPSPA